MGPFQTEMSPALLGRLLLSLGSEGTWAYSKGVWLCPKLPLLERREMGEAGRETEISRQTGKENRMSE